MSEDTAAVLAGLVKTLQDRHNKYSRVGLNDFAAGLRLAVSIARNVQKAATGARAAGAETEALDRAARKMHEFSEMRGLTWERANASRKHGHWHDVMRERAQAVIDAYAAAPPAPSTGVVSNEAGDPRRTPLPGHPTSEPAGSPTSEHEHGPRSAQAVPGSLPTPSAPSGQATAAPPAPSAPGVAELLAECVRRVHQSVIYRSPAVMSCDEIVRYLAPGGADGEGNGT